MANEKEPDNIPEIDEEDIEEIDEEEDDEEDEDEELPENPTKRIHVCTLNTQVEVVSSDPGDSLDKIKGMVINLIDRYK